MSVGLPTLGAIGFVRTAASRRAATYRNRAAQLRDMAESEPPRKIREDLRALARRYEDLADSLD